MGFVGRVEYRHVRSQSGGAQYGLAATANKDLLIVYAEAFERDANPEDFSLEAIIAHERGHQVVCRDPRLQRLLAEKMSVALEEVLASLVASLLVDAARDRRDLALKAVAEAVLRGAPPDDATRLVAELRGFLEKVL